MPRGFLGGWSQARGGVLEGTSNQASDGHRGLIRREGGMPVPFGDGWDAQQLWGWRGGVSLQIWRQTRNPKCLWWPPVEHACVTLKTGGGWCGCLAGAGGPAVGVLQGKGTMAGPRHVTEASWRWDELREGQKVKPTPALHAAEIGGGGRLRCGLRTHSVEGHSKGDTGGILKSPRAG